MCNVKLYEAFEIFLMSDVYYDIYEEAEELDKCMHRQDVTGHELYERTNKLYISAIKLLYIVKFADAMVNAGIVFSEEELSFLDYCENVVADICEKVKDAMLLLNWHGISDVVIEELEAILRRIEYTPITRLKDMVFSKLAKEIGCWK